METAHYINTQMTKVGVQTPVETAHYINTQMTKVGVQTPVEIAHYIKYTNDCLRKTKVLCIDVRHFAHHDVDYAWDYNTSLSVTVSLEIVRDR